MILVCTIIIGILLFLRALTKEVDKERAAPIGATELIGAMFGFIVTLLISIVVGILLEKTFDISLIHHLIIFSVLVIFFVYVYRSIKYFYDPGNNDISMSQSNQSVNMSKFLFGGKQLDLNEYLKSKDYMSRKQYFFWKTGVENECGDVYQDSNGNFWDADLNLVDEGGERIIIYAEIIDENSQNYTVQFSYFRGSSFLGDSVSGHASIFSCTACIDSDTGEEGFWLELDEAVLDFNYAVIDDDSDPLYLKVFHEDFDDVYYFKHGNNLLDSRELEDKNWFHHYSLRNIDERDVLSAIEKIDFENDEEGPYLWWITDSIAEKTGFITYQDNRRNSFYVKKGSNLGVCAIHDGEALEDKRVELRLFFDGYFNIKVKYC
jgi:Ca2+/Na+ antiporter